MHGTYHGAIVALQLCHCTCDVVVKDFLAVGVDIAIDELVEYNGIVEVGIVFVWGLLGGGGVIVCCSTYDNHCACVHSIACMIINTMQGHQKQLL